MGSSSALRPGSLWKWIWIRSMPLPYTVLLLLTCTEAVEDSKFGPLTRDFLELLQDDTRYNRYASPTQEAGGATNISISMYIEGISSFSAQTMDFQMDVYFQQAWLDPRLSHNSSFPILVRDRSVFKLFWRTDLYFANARKASFQDITEDNFLVWIHPNGKVFYDCRISLVVICMMDLWKYPLDSQTCELRILSYAYPESVLRLHWTESESMAPIDHNPDIRMPDMRLKQIATGTCNGTYATGTWSCLTGVFLVERERLHHIMQTYLPTALIVIISWFSFWLDVDSAPARVSLSITTLLTISTQANAVKLALPEVAYMKAIDAWMAMCMSFVFAVMIEFTVCHFAKNRELHKSANEETHLIVDSALSTLFGVERHLSDMSRSDIEADGEPRLGLELTELRADSHCFIGAERLHRKKKRSVPGVSRIKENMSRRALSIAKAVRNLRGRAVANKIDERCRIMFPLCFFLLNIIYWSYYLVMN